MGKWGLNTVGCHILPYGLGILLIGFRSAGTKSKTSLERPRRPHSGIGMHIVSDRFIFSKVIVCLPVKEHGYDILR
jgi:hypothetical protein